MAEEVSGDVPSLDSLEARLFDDLIPLASSIKFDGRSYDELIPMLVFCSILEGAWSTILLARHGLRMQAYVLLRTLLENVVELQRLVTIDTAVADFRLRSEKQIVRTLERARDGNPYFAEINSKTDVKSAIDNKKIEIKELEEDGGRATNIAERFASIGARVDYEGLYHKLSDETHTSMLALNVRFIDVSSGDLQFRAFHGASEDEFEALRGSVEDLLTKAQELFSRKFLRYCPT